MFVILNNQDYLNSRGVPLQNISAEQLLFVKIFLLNKYLNTKNRLLEAAFFHPVILSFEIIWNLYKPSERIPLDRAEYI